VTCLLRDDASMAESEDLIDRQAISEEDSAVLWLRAWAERSDVGLLRGWSSGHTRGDG
jgi:hypothetical protein